MVDLSEGDMRRSITLLQTAHRYTPTIEVDTIDHLAGVVPLAAVEQVLTAAQGGHEKIIAMIEVSAVRRLHCARFV